MRAEGQAHIDRIEAALALVRKFLDWDRAVRRSTNSTPVSKIPSCGTIRRTPKP
jgi:hypothetical protein